MVASLLSLFEVVYSDTQGNTFAVLKIPKGILTLELYNISGNWKVSSSTDPRLLLELLVAIGKEIKSGKKNWKHI